MADQKQKSSGIGFFGLLALIFIALKLTGHIDWSWWWVLAPLWWPIPVVVVAVLVAVACKGTVKVTRK